MKSFSHRKSDACKSWYLGGLVRFLYELLSSWLKEPLYYLFLAELFGFGLEKRIPFLYLLASLEGFLRIVRLPCFSRPLFLGM
jgi:hypothetical protein